MALANANPYNNYVRQGVMTASPGELTLMLYDGMIKFVKRAKLNIEEKKIEDANNNLKRAQDIVMELINTLDLNYTLSDRLLAIYDFVNHELIMANVEKNTKRLDDVLEVVTDLRDTWQQAIRLNRRMEHGTSLKNSDD